MGVSMMMEMPLFFGSFLILLQTSKPLILGIITSSRIKSGGSLATIFSASNPSRPWIVRLSRRDQIAVHYALGVHVFSAGVDDVILDSHKTGRSLAFIGFCAA